MLVISWIYREKGRDSPRATNICAGAPSQCSLASLSLRSRMLMLCKSLFFSVLTVSVKISGETLLESLSHMRLPKTASCASMRRFMAGSWVVYRVLFACVITIRRRQQKQPINSRIVKTGPGHLTLLDQTHGMSVCHRDVQVSRRVIFSTATGLEHPERSRSQ
ncbi:hypothetical protein ASPVEDRAFT_804205 [Aspergillus versicolor CBS 583.65]|uniref:Uncharacterized protein n=1 Tax=Aspergillus versicolor CBS 583.65 TaxID=1036611 RepID=A0A1L9PSW2_ASPVE|nr:uncharacterized protein ASPVEDRAFT_804205 [Aspergillus versicolor CBS 583.65]OJJ04614.1 hypothetical protein ASPVEDRAFT_804205 [Aspergillus versicolor CBS 583.65]